MGDGQPREADGAQWHLCAAASRRHVDAGVARGAMRLWLAQSHLMFLENEHMPETLSGVQWLKGRLAVTRSIGAEMQTYQIGEGEVPGQYGTRRLSAEWQ